MAKKPARPSRSLWEDQSTDYNPEAPSVVKALRGEKWKRRALMTIAFGVLPLCGIIALGIVSDNVSPSEAVDLSGASTATNSSAGKAAAYTAVADWLAASPSPLPDATIVSWNGYTVEDPPPADPNDSTSQPAYQFETHTFTLTRGGQLFTSTVQVAVDGAAAATVTTTPSLTPVAEASVAGDVVPWFATDPATASSHVSDAVEAWADAFTSGDPGKLVRVVQDKDDNHSYVPLTGVASVASVEIIDAAYIPTGDSKKPTEMLVRVELSVWWDGQEPVDGEQGGDSAGKDPTAITYDLLIADAGTASPYVVAWGGPGSGTSLKPYSNALDGVDLELATPEPGSKPAPTQSNGGEE